VSEKLNGPSADEPERGGAQGKNTHHDDSQRAGSAGAGADGAGGRGAAGSKPGSAPLGSSGSSGLQIGARPEGVPGADLTAGAQYVLPLPVAHKRYLRGYFTVQGTATAGKVDVVIASGIQMNNPAPESPNVWGSRK